MRAKVRDLLGPRGDLTVISDASSCTDSLAELTDGGLTTVVDVTAFAVEHLLPRLTVTHPIDSIALHPTCATTRLGTTDALVAIAEFISPDVYVPFDWACCGFAGDRGLLHPELTESAAAEEAAEVNRREFAAYASSNRTCEIGMSRATGRTYRHIIELLAEATR